MDIQDYMLAYIEKHLIKQFKEGIAAFNKYKNEPIYIITPHGTEEELKYIEDFLLCLTTFVGLKKNTKFLKQIT